MKQALSGTRVRTPEVSRIPASTRDLLAAWVPGGREVCSGVCFSVAVYLLAVIYKQFGFV